MTILSMEKNTLTLMNGVIGTDTNVLFGTW